jgi:hypothetical protein
MKLPAGPDWVHEVKHDGYRLRRRQRASSASNDPPDVSDGSGFNASACAVIVAPGERRDAGFARAVGRADAFSCPWGAS